MSINVNNFAIYWPFFKYHYIYIFNACIEVNVILILNLVTGLKLKSEPNNTYGELLPYIRHDHWFGVTTADKIAAACDH